MKSPSKPYDSFSISITNNEGPEPIYGIRFFRKTNNTLETLGPVELNEGTLLRLKNELKKVV